MTSRPYIGPLLVVSPVEVARIYSALFGSPSTDLVARDLLARCEAVLNSDPRFREPLKP